MLCYLLFLSVCSTVFSQAFNFEIAKRVQDNVAQFLLKPKTPILEVVELFNVGAFDASSTVALRQLQFAQLVVLGPAVDILYAGLENGLVSGYTQRTRLYMFSANDTTQCKQAEAPCLDLWTTATNGAPLAPFFSFGYVVQQRPWYIGAKANGSVWSSIYSFQVGKHAQLAITFSAPIRDQHGIFIGAAAIDFFISSLEKFLFESYNSDPDVLVVYITDDQGYIVASSSPNTTFHPDNTTQVRVFAQESESRPIKESSQFFATLDTSISTEGRVFVHADYYVQTTTISADHGLNWKIIVVSPIHKVNDHVEIGSTAFYTCCTLSSLVALITLVLIFWVVRFHRMQLWKAAQPVALVMILVSNFVCMCSVSVLVGKPSDILCVLRQWCVSLSVTMTCASFLAKMVRIYVLIHEGSILKPSMSNTHMVALVVLILFIQCLVLTVWTILGPMKAIVEHKTLASNLVVEVTVCSRGSQVGVALLVFVIIVLFFCSAYLAFLTRKMSESFAESRALAFTFYHGAFLLIVMVVVWRVTTVSMQALTLFVIMAMLWFTVVTQASLFAPRLLRQLMYGDFTKAEMRLRVTRHLSSGEQVLIRSGTNLETPGISRRASPSLPSATPNTARKTPNISRKSLEIPQSTNTPRPTSEQRSTESRPTTTSLTDLSL